MSGYRTHMLIGAVGGLGAYRIAEFFDPSTVTFRFTLAGGSFIVPPFIVGLACAYVSMYMALWPDIDERGSYISNRAERYMWLWAAMLTLCFAICVTQSVVLILFLVIVGAVLGRFGVGVFLYVLRVVSGGHRHLTHSLVLGMALLVGAGVLYIVGAIALALPIFALGWGLVMHLIGDVVTPGGVPLFYPLSTRNIHLFPYWISKHGELLIGFLSFLAGMFFLFV